MAYCYASCMQVKTRWKQRFLDDISYLVKQLLYIQASFYLAKRGKWFLILIQNIMVSVSLLQRIKRSFPRGDGSSQVLLSCKYMGFFRAYCSISSPWPCHRRPKPMWTIYPFDFFTSSSSFTFHVQTSKLGLGKHHGDRKLPRCSVKKYAEFSSRHALICDLALWLCSSIFLLVVGCARDTVLQFLLESVWHKRWMIGPKSSSLGLLCLEQ